MIDDSEENKLRCLVEPHDNRRLFSPSVLPTETIYDLQELVFLKRGQAL